MYLDDSLVVVRVGRVDGLRVELLLFTEQVPVVIVEPLARLESFLREVGASVSPRAAILPYIPTDISFRSSTRRLVRNIPLLLLCIPVIYAITYAGMCVRERIPQRNDAVSLVYTVLVSYESVYENPTKRCHANTIFPHGMKVPHRSMSCCMTSMYATTHVTTP